MREILASVERWRAAGTPVAIATVVKVWGSAPRPLGAKMAISGEGALAGSVSGGCVEGAVAEEAQAVLTSGIAKLISFGVSDEEAWAVGLSCGGRIDIYVEPLAASAGNLECFERLATRLRDERLVAQATLLSLRSAAQGNPGARLLLSPTGRLAGGLGSELLDRAATAKAHELFASFRAERFAVGEAELFIEVLPPRPKLVIVGAVHTAMALVTFAKALGFSTVVVDPRTAFATAERFAHADRLLSEWPAEAFAKLDLNEATYIALLSHDLKIDLPALRLALASPARYIGALGSKKTHAKRVAALAEEGFTDQQIGRIHAPIGIHLGGRKPAEIAVSIIAEIVAVSHGRGTAS